MKKYNFNPKATKYDVCVHFDTLSAGLKYYQNRANNEKVSEIDAEMQQMRDTYSYLQ